MARIRSIHPGIYTDEAWASVSIAARWFAKGLCTEADDNGTFEWKPLQLKMRIFPADAVDVPELFGELVAAGIVMQFTAEGKTLGALRNFCKYQRPRKPKAWFPTTAESREFVALGAEPAADEEAEAAPVPQKSELTPVKATLVPPKSEMSPQMEDGGWRVEELEAIASCPADAGTGAGKRKSKAKEVAAKPAWASDPDYCAAWEACTTQMRARSESRERTYVHWKRQAALCGSGGNLLHALRRYLKDDPDAKRTGGPGFHVWLSEGRWDHWTAAGAQAAVRAVWIGPPEIRNAVIREVSEEFARSYLDTCAWLDGSLVPRTAYSAEKLRRLRALRDVAILEPQGAAA